MDSFVDLLPRPLREDIVENRCIPIIGAGFSRNATTVTRQEMPLWKDIGMHFANQIGEKYPYANPLDPISDFCHRFGKAKAVEQLRRILYTGKIKPSSAHLAFASLFFDTVITTNFDFLLEQAYTHEGREFLPILDEDQLPVSDISLFDNKITRILKIHGDLNHPRKMVITEEDYDSYVLDHPLMATHIANLLLC